MKKNSFFKSAALLSIISIITRIMGFFYRIFLSQTFGEESVGLYQLIFPIYIFCLSISSYGIQTALSRIVAFQVGRKDDSDAKTTLYIALVISCILSFICLLTVQKNTSVLASQFIGDIRCQNMLLLMSYAIPFASIHGCICGYYFGLKNSTIPAISQLLEQLFRIFTVFSLCYYFKQKGYPFTIQVAVIGLVIGELASSLCSILSLKQRDKKVKMQCSYQLSAYLHKTKELTALSVPLSANRIILTLLQSFEAVSIPKQLQIYGYPISDSLKIYGVLTGMALPCIMFPSAITNSFAVLLTPTVAGIQSSSDKTHLTALIKKTIAIGFSIGLAACVFFLLFGNLMGTYLFHSNTAGKFILILAWICPFLYLNTALASILNGLGKVNTTFFINFLGIIIRILSIFCIIPLYDLKGYLWGLLMSQMFCSLFYFSYLKSKYL